MSGVSTNYREIRRDEVDAVAGLLDGAWQNSSIPMSQYAIAEPELVEARKGNFNATFAALIRCCERIPGIGDACILDVGASAGYNSEVIKLSCGYCCYEAVDFSVSFKELAARLYPDLKFTVADARALPYEDNAFDVVLSGAVLMHLHDYPKAIAEAARVSKQYVIFHRTPIRGMHSTASFVKDAYDVPVYEVHFNEYELMTLFGDYGLDLVYQTDIFGDNIFRHTSYLLKKR